jgi:hypothetical protein
MACPVDPVIKGEIYPSRTGTMALDFIIDWRSRVPSQSEPYLLPWASNSFECVAYIRNKGQFSATNSKPCNKHYCTKCMKNLAFLQKKLPR